VRGTVCRDPFSVRCLDPRKTAHQTAKNELSRQELSDQENCGKGNQAGRVYCFARYSINVLILW